MWKPSDVVFEQKLVPELVRLSGSSLITFQSCPKLLLCISLPKTTKLVLKNNVKYNLVNRGKSVSYNFRAQAFPWKPCYLTLYTKGSKEIMWKASRMVFRLKRLIIFQSCPKFLLCRQPCGKLVSYGFNIKLVLETLVSGIDWKAYLRQPWVYRFVQFSSSIFFLKCLLSDLVSGFDGKGSKAVSREKLFYGFQACFWNLCPVYQPIAIKVLSWILKSMLQP